MAKATMFDGDISNRERARLKAKKRKEAIRDLCIQYVNKAAVACDAQVGREGMAKAIDAAFPFPQRILVCGESEMAEEGDARRIWEEEKGKMLDARFPDISRESIQAAFDAKDVIRYVSHHDLDGNPVYGERPRLQHIDLFGGAA